MQCLMLPADPQRRMRSGEVQVLLGIPRLYDVNANINVGGFKVEIGGPSRGEAVQCFQGPQQKFNRDHSLLMFTTEGCHYDVADTPLNRQSFANQVTATGEPDGGQDVDRS